MMILRDIAYGVGGLLLAPIWATAMLKTGKWKTDWSGKLLGKATPHLQSPPSKVEGKSFIGRTLLIHAVSVGEVMATRSLVETLETQAPNLRIVVATTTNTGFDRAMILYSDRHHVVRYPLDFSWAVKRFLRTVKPDLVALTELEVWPNFVEACDKRGIPVAVINGRLTERSYNRYLKVKFLIESSFKRLSAAAVQTEDYAKRFKGLGAREDCVHILDTMKWDTAKIDDEVDGTDELGEEFGLDRGKLTVVAGSTGPGEEKLLIESMRELGDVNLVIVPRKPERFNEVAELDERIIRMTDIRNGKAKSGDGSIYLLDTMGELRKAYGLADVVIVGRSFNGLGGSDLIEPIGLGKAVVIGNSYFNFGDAVDAFAEGDGVIVANEGDLAGNLKGLLDDKGKRKVLSENGRAVIRNRQGATQRHANMLLGLLPE
ncbi:hypothetical protein JD969_04245 [Planctomycetota bacterium]|nr:hypothetical protein JD969_04245 [Planctomycetota bacterium]